MELGAHSSMRTVILEGGNILRSNSLLPVKSSPLIVRSVFALALLTILALCKPVFSSAASLTGDSSTYIQSREQADGSKVLGGYEYLDFAVQDIGSETVSFHTGGWLRQDFETAEFGKESNSDLQYSYLSFKSKIDNTVVNLGRVMVFEGVAAERVDGLYARTDLNGGFGISAFGGSPVETEINTPGNNLIYGGRLSHQMGDIYKIGISALEEDKDSLAYRKEEGIDLWLHPLTNVDITGRSSYNDITKGWMENTYVLMLGPFAKLRLDTTASWITYDNYFFRTTTSAFSLQNGLITPGEKVRMLGETASYPITDNVQITADYKNFDYVIAGNANYYGATIKYTVPESGSAGFGYHNMDGDTDTLKYNEYRVYGSKKIGKFGLTADVLDVVYASPVNGVKNSYSGSLAAMYDLSEAWKLGADVDYYHDPEFNHDVRAFVKLLYHFGAKGGA